MVSPGQYNNDWALDFNDLQFEPGSDTLTQPYDMQHLMSERFCQLPAVMDPIMYSYSNMPTSMPPASTASTSGTNPESPWTLQLPTHSGQNYAQTRPTTITSPDNVQSASPTNTISAASSLGEANEEFRCPECSATFTKTYELNTHLKKHNPPFACAFCEDQGIEKRFRYKKDLTRHEKSKHVEPDEFFCSREGCKRANGGVPFKRADDRRKHERAHLKKGEKRSPIGSSTGFDAGSRFDWDVGTEEQE